MPINNALTPQGQNALGAAFGYYPQLRRNRRNQDPQAALDMPVQFLRGRLASTLGMPSDVLNTFQSPLPMEVYGDVDYSAAQQVPYGTQDLLQQLPLAPTGPAQQAAANLGSVVPLTPMEALQAARLARQAALAGGQAVASTGRALAPVAGDMLTNYMVKRNMILPLDVYHGTPHTLPPTPRNPLGEFDASKIGTGEGAQAYGHGIYTAEAPSVAQQYQKDISRLQFAQGKIPSQDTIAGKPMAQFYDALQRKADKLPPNLAASEYEKLSFLEDLMQQSNFDDAIKRIDNEAIIPWAKSLKEQYKPAGNLYKIDLPDEMIAKMLDWDKPLSQQDPAVRKMITESFPGGYINGVYIDPVKSQLTGKALLDQLSMIANKRNEPGFRSAETALRQAGIPGIKYLDATSRDAGKGTRNFVTFPGEEKKMTILERNGQGLTPALLPQQLALELAQQRAALPVSKGGLGLPADNTAQQRAAAMGINVETNYIHSTNRPFNQITDDGKFSGIFTLPNYSSNYGLIDMPLVTGEKIATTQDLQNLIKNPAKKIQRAIDETIPLNLTDPTDIADATVEMQKLRNQLAKKYGFDGVKISDEFGNDTVALVNPDNIRSRFAAFDPFRKTAATAALMGVAAPDLLAAQSGRGSDNEMRKFMRQGR